MAHTKVTKTYSQNTGVANTFSYSGSFDVFKATEVVVELDNVELTYTASTINESASPRQYTVDTVAKTIHIGGADLSSGAVIIRPDTDMGEPSPRATYTPGSSITADDLNNNQLQIMRKCMEYDENLLSTTGGTMTGDLGIGEDQTIIFEGATDDGYETTLTVADPTADRTITLPNVTGTVVTTGDTGTVAHAMLAADAVDGDNIGDDSINSEHIVDGSVDLAHLSANSVNSSKIVDDSIVNADINSSAAIAHSKLANVTSGQILVGNGSNVPTAVAVSGDVTLSNAGAVTIATGAVEHAMLAGDCIDGDNIQDSVVNSEHYVDGSIDHEHLANDVIDGDNIQDDAVAAEHVASNAIVNDSVAAGAAIAHSKLANITDGQILVGNGSNVPTAVAVSGDVTIANTGAVTIANDAVEIAMIGCEQTTISDSDSHIPTSGAVVDYVTSRIAPIGGLEVIADDESFPNTIPPAGVVISITDAAGLQVNSSGVSTNGDALDNSTITINGFPSELRGGVGSNPDPYVFQSGAGLMVQSTGSSQTYNYHQAMIRESDFVQLSDDINDFNSRYRIGTRTANSSDTNDDGDLFFDTGTNKMYVYDGAYDSGGEWKEVTSAGDYKFLTIKDHDQAVGGSGPTYGSNVEFDLFDGSSDASITNAAQLIVVLNGVVQKPNASYSGSMEGFSLNDTHGIKFATAPPSGSTMFVTQIGTATTISTPGTGSISNANMFAAGVINAAAIGTGAVEHAKLGADCIDGDNIQDDAINSEHITNGSIDHVHLATDIIDGDNIQDDVINSEHYAAASIDHEHLADDCVDGDNIADNSVGLAAMAHGTDGNLITYNASGEPAHVATGNDGQVLTSQGAGQPPQFEDAASGAIGANIFHNPAFQVWQRGVTLTGCEVDTYTADRWKQWGGQGGQSGRATYERSTDVPDSVATVESMKISCTTTETPGASEGYMIMQRLEGRDTHHLQWGTSNARAVTISFWCKGDAAKTYTLSIYRSSSTDRTFTKTFNVTTSWSKVTITVPGDTSAAHSDITQNSQINWKVMVGISLMQGTQSATDNSWQNSGSGKYAVSGNDNFFESTDRRLYLAAMKMEIGSSATDFEQPDATMEQKRCERYLEYVVRGNNDPIITGALFAGDMVTGVIPFRTMKRTTSPSMISAGGTDYLRLRYTYTGTGSNNTIDGDNFSLQYKSETAAGVWFTGFDVGNNTTMGAGGLLYAINADVRLAFSSEL